MNQTENIQELVAALSKAQGKMKPAVFNRVNPHFKNRYADFTSCMDACRIPLCENGLSVMQYCETVNDKLALVTMLAHTSGQYVKSYFPLSPRSMESQAIGSAMTYAKRYSLSAILGIVSDEEDDDGEAAHGRPAQPTATPAVKMNEKQIEAIKKIDMQLDDECKEKLYKWLEIAYKTRIIEELPANCFAKVLGSFENALNFMKQNKKEEINA